LRFTQPPVKVPEFLDDDSQNQLTRRETSGYGDGLL